MQEEQLLMIKKYLFFKFTRIPRKPSWMELFWGQATLLKSEYTQIKKSKPSEILIKKFWSTSLENISELQLVQWIQGNIEENKGLLKINLINFG